jgi:aspartyl-tRNA(Asn)/glutamyl-tRNA(Gln) amidotransferase subunit A
MLNLDPTSWSASFLSAQLASRRISPVDVIEAYLEKIRITDPFLHAFVDLYEPQARIAAETADKAIRSGNASSPFHGVPIVLKDLIELDGQITTAGSKVWANHRSACTATLAKRLIAHGIIVLGKTHTVEFALGGWGINQHLGTPRNPWDLQVHRAPGGSSSGSAVAVAGGLSPWAVGTDTGGSVRLPAAWCGIVGLKPSKGRISCHGVVPLSPSFDTPGPMARAVEDAALLLGLMQGPDPLDSSTLGVAADDPMPALRRGVAGLRLGVLPDSELSDPASEVADAYAAALETLARLGACLIPVTLPRRLAEYAGKNPIMMAEAYALYGDMAGDANLPLDDFVRSRLRAAARIEAADYIRALQRQKQLREEFRAVFDEVDGLLTPTTRTTAIALEEIDRDTPPTVFTRCASLLNLSALAVPNGFDAAGLPISLQVICREFDETTALRIGWAYQQATEWHERRPPMSAAQRRVTRRIEFQETMRRAEQVF